MNILEWCVKIVYLLDVKYFICLFMQCFDGLFLFWLFRTICAFYVHFCLPFDFLWLSVMTGRHFFSPEIRFSVIGFIKVSKTLVIQPIRNSFSSNRHSHKLSFLFACFILKSWASVSVAIMKSLWLSFKMYCLLFV